MTFDIGLHVVGVRAGGCTLCHKHLFLRPKVFNISNQWGPSARYKSIKNLFFLMPLSIGLVVIFMTIIPDVAIFRENAAKRSWGLWTSINSAANKWNFLDLSLRGAASLSSFKQNVFKVTFFYF